LTFDGYGADGFEQEIAEATENGRDRDRGFFGREEAQQSQKGFGGGQTGMERGY